MEEEQQQQGGGAVGAAVRQGGNAALKAVGKMGKQFAKKAMKALAKKAIAFIIKPLIAGILKIVAVLVAALGVPVLIGLLIAVVAGSVIYLAFSFGWLSDDSGVDKDDFMKRYQTASELTAENPDYRAPVWLIQAIDNVSILKEGREPEEIEPERIYKGLEAEIEEEERKNSESTWSDSSSRRTTKNTDVTVVMEVRTWNRLITYEYVQLTNLETISNYSEVSGDKESGGTDYSSYSRSYNHWELTSTEAISYSGGVTTSYNYSLLNDYEHNSTSIPLKGKDDESTHGSASTSSYSRYATFAGTSNSTEQISEKEVKTTTTNRYTDRTSNNSGSYQVELRTFSSSSSSSSSSYKENTTWTLSKVTEVVDYGKLTSRLLELGYTVSDYDFIKEAILENDPYSKFIDEYDPSLLLPDDGGLYWYGGTIGHSPQIIGSGEWAYPTSLDAVITSGFGLRSDPFNSKSKMHNGVDLARSNSSMDYPIYAVSEGEVTWAGYRDNGYGYYVTIDHGDGVSTLYGHMKAGSLQVKTGDTVVPGQALGIMGTTGRSTGIHLHFEVRIDNGPVNPLMYIRK
ncbi:M23 family metallopeptidase [Paenibacillus sp. GXUN7292]|uniref:M23 family metallopeptidase n=1 Tax=Paenibacillus sp. GXUN7292 TaxID=3422499 RepID=UPI003D7C62A2